MQYLLWVTAGCPGIPVGIIAGSKREDKAISSRTDKRYEIFI